MRIKIVPIICSILAMLSWTPSGGLFALPQGESVESGSAVFERPDPATTNNITTLKIIVDDRSVINFNSFNIAQNEAVYFIQPSASASVLSRVTGAGASEIAGILSANGTLFFVNQNGIRFTPSAQVNVNSLIASTLDISTNNFINGNYILEHSLYGVFSHILNEGRITGNNIALVASGVHNAGVIAARAGTTHLASGDKVTVSFDQKGLIQVEINAETSGQVVDLQGNSVKDAVANSGTIEAKEVVMNAQTAANIFENAVNQTGIVKATAITQEGGVIRIRSNRNIQVSGTLEAAAGGVTVNSGESIAVKEDLITAGNTNIMADNDIYVSSNIETVDGDLALIADADLNGEGSFRQASGTLISTINYGDIIIQSSGASTLANIMAAGDLILKQGGSAAIFTQHPGSHISTAGSLSIGQGVTLHAANTHYSIGKNLINAGSFDPQDSLFELVSDLPAIIQGSITFNDLKVIVPGKKVSVTAGDTITIEGILTLQGSYGDLLTIVSTEPGIQWKILPLGGTDIAYSQIGDCFNARGPPLAAIHSNSLGNNSNVLMNSYWTGQGISNNWSDPDNWDSGIAPAQFDTVNFDGISCLYSFNNSFIDPDFSGTIANLVIDGYTGIVTLGRDITVTRDITLASGTLKAQNHTILVGGDWAHQGGDFQPGTSTVVFYDPAQPSFISGNSTFYNFTSTTASKIIYFEAGTTTAITGTLKLQGSFGQHVRLLSSEQGKQWYMYPQGPRDITYTWVEDSYNLDPAKVMMLESTNRGNCFNWDPTATWTGNISNLWSVAGNWIGLGGAAPGAGDDLVFPAGCLTLSTSNDFAAGTSFNSITITGSGYTLAGNSIILGAGGLTTDAIAGSNTISLDIACAATRTITVTNSDETLTISGIISAGAGVGLTKAGSGTLVLSGVNTYQGATTINAGTLSIAADSGLGQAPGGATAGHLTFGAGTLLTTATFSLNSNRGITLGAGGGTLNVDTATVLTYGGIIAGSNPLTKLGAGELVLQGISTNDSTVTLNGGTFTLSGANGTMASATFTVNQGAILNLDNSTDGTNNPNRISNTNAITLTGGEFIFRGTSTASTNASETVGTLTLPSGASRVTVVSGTGGSTVLTFADISRTAGATVLFRGDSLGNNPAANVSNILFTNTATITNATNFIGTTSGALANDTTTNIKIIPWAFGDIASAGSGTSFVTFNTDRNGGTNGIRPLKTTEYVANSFATASVNVRITDNTNAAARTINSLLLDGGNVSYASNLTVTVTSGAVARVSGGDIAATASSKTRYLAFGTAEGVIFAIGSFYIAPRITGSGGLTISGGGTVEFPISTSPYFGTAKTYTGTTTVNEGGLTTNLAAAIATSSVVTIAAPATFTKGNVALTVTTLNLYSGNTAGAQVVLGSSALTLLAAGGGTITLQVNGSGAVGATISTISTGTLALGASRTITVADGSAENDLTIAVVISGSSFGITKEGAGTLALTQANSYTGITTLNAGTLSVEIMRNGGIACGVGASTNVATNLVFNGGTFKYTGVTVSTDRLFTIGTTSGVTFDVSGIGTLTFAGASMTLSGTDTARTITFTGTGSAVLTNVIPDNGAGATTVVKNGSGTWLFKGINTYTGTTTINAGILKIQADSGLGAAPAAATPGHINLNGGKLQTIADFALNANRGIALTKAGTIFVDSTTTLTYGGIIAGSNILTKDGAGTLILQGVNTYSSATVINNGTLTLSGANGSILNSTSVTINPEATLILDNLSANNFDRIADGVDIDMYGGYFILIGCGSAATFETVGALNVIAGSNYVTIRDSVGGATVMTFTSFSRVAGAMVLFRGTNLGSAPGDNVSTIMFTTAPALTGGGGAAGTTTVSIIQGAFGSNSPSGTGTDMVTYNINDNAFGLRLLNKGGFTGEYETSVLTVPNSNVKLSTSVAPGAGITINSLILASGGAVATSANTLTIASGNILALEGNGGINGSSVLAFGATPGIIRAVGDLTISSQITGSAGLTTGGVGTITLSNASNSFTGGIRISQGVVKISEDADLGAGSGAGYITFFGGTLRTTADFTLNSNRGIFLKSAGTIFTDPGTTLTYNGIIA
ncbi:MAG TPA: autotransporter-associated beta strand repeat-containing protein, partial [Candidatus Omnitrophota bacterium]|nr:autotransporter-associated beta strand repeat-containing protein [Candidatus Omnitrophota bacterium]